MKTRTFEAVWQDIKKLEGKDVFTLRRHYRNRIEKVDETGLKTFPTRGEYSHWVTKGAFETVWKKLLNGGFVPVEGGGYYFVCACLATLHDVGYSVKDGIIFLYLKP